MDALEMESVPTRLRFFLFPRRTGPRSLFRPNEIETDHTFREWRVGKREGEYGSEIVSGGCLIALASWVGVADWRLCARRHVGTRI